MEGGWGWGREGRGDWYRGEGLGTKPSKPENRVEGSVDVQNIRRSKLKASRAYEDFLNVFLFFDSWKVLGGMNLPQD